MWSHLILEWEFLHLHAKEAGFYFETSCLRSRGDVKDDVLKPQVIQNR